MSNNGNVRPDLDLARAGRAVASGSAVDELYGMFLDAGRSRRNAASTPTPAVCVVGWRDDDEAGIRVHLVRQRAEHALFPGQWTLPAREIDTGADPADAARELARSSALEVADATGALKAGFWITPPAGPVRWHVDVYVVRCAPGPSRPAAAPAEARWALPREALARWARGEWLVPPWTRAALEAFVPGADGAQARIESAARSAGHARLHELAPGVAVLAVRTPTLPPATHTNCYVLGTRAFVVVDPASPYPDQQAALAEAIDERVARGDRPLAVLLTHHHSDHVGGATQLSAHLGVPIWAHARTADLLRGRVTVDRALDDGDDIDVGGAQPIRAVLTPGHAPGHLCFLEPATRLLVAGDMVAGIGTIVVEPEDGDMRLYLGSLERMKALAPRALLPAHGPAIADPGALLDRYVQHRLWREERVLSALRELGPAPARALVPRAYADVPPMIHPLAERSLIAHLIKLEGDDAVSVNGEVWRAN